MNTLENATIRAPSDTDETCAKLTIDDILTPFVFHAIAKIGEPYTLSFYIKAETEGEVEAGGKTMAVTTEWTRFVASFVSSSVDVPIYFKTAGTYYMFNCQLEIGNKVSDWRPAAEDTDVTTAKIMAAIELSKSEILSTVSYTYALQTEVDDIQSWRQVATQQITKDGIISTVGSYYATSTELSAAESKITQNANSITSIVEDGGVISLINQTAGSVKIDASKIDLSASDIVNIIGGSSVKIAAANIDLTGYVTATDLSTAGKTTIVGDNITSGTITGIHFVGATGDFTGTVTATELVATTSGKISIFEFDSSSMIADFTGDGIVDYGFQKDYFCARVYNSSNVERAYLYMDTEDSISSVKGRVVIYANDHIRLSVPSTGHVRIFNETDGSNRIYFYPIGGIEIRAYTSAEAYYYAKNGKREGRFTVSTTGRLGIYDNTNSEWMFYSEQAGTTTYFMKALEVRGVSYLKGGLELYGTYPNVDFHKDSSSADYTSRICEYSSGVLNINGVTFTLSTSSMAAAKGTFHGTYTSTAAYRYSAGALEIRESSLVGSAQSDIGYAPSIGFHWSGRTAASIVLDSSGRFQFLNQQGSNAPIISSYLWVACSGTTEAQVVVSNGGINGLFCASQTYKLGIYNNTAGAWSIYAETNNNIVIGNKAVVPPSGTAAVRGNGDGVYDCGHTSHLWKAVYAKDGVKTTSDEREKDILNLDLSEMSDFFMSLEPIAFRWAYGNDRKIHLGVGAQTTERKMIEAGYDPSLFDMIQHDDLEERSVSGLMERYGINYQDLNMFTMMQTQKTTREFTAFVTAFAEWKSTVDVDLSLFRDEQDELKEEVQNLKIELALANQKIAELSAKTA